MKRLSKSYWTDTRIRFYHNLSFVKTGIWRRSFQEVFIKIIDTLRKGSYNHREFSQWATRIAYNMCVDHFRRSKKQRPKSITSDEFDIFDVLRGGWQQRTSVWSSVRRHAPSNTHIGRQVADEQREVVILRHYYADLGFKEISSITSVSINTALGRMR